MNFKIEKLLKELPTGAIQKFYEALGITRQGLWSIYTRGTPTFRTMEKHTAVFNKLFGTNYIYTDLFSKIKNNEK